MTENMKILLTGYLPRGHKLISMRYTNEERENYAIRNRKKNVEMIYRYNNETFRTVVGSCGTRYGHK